jgi:hypothetical protein
MDAITFLAKRFITDPTYVHRRIADECLLVPIRRQVVDLQYIYVLNPVANRIWELLDGKRTMAEVRDRLLEEFEVSAGELEQDLQEYLEELQEIQAVREL